MYFFCLLFDCFGQQSRVITRIYPTIIRRKIILFDDGIGVKKQKENRSKNQDVVIGEPDKSARKQKRKTVITDVVLLQTTKGSFEYLTSRVIAFILYQMYLTKQLQ